MKTKIKKVYYCDFCKKHSLTSWSLEKHEKHCTLNPQRYCRICQTQRVNEHWIKKLQDAFKTMEAKKQATPSSPAAFSYSGEIVSEFQHKFDEIKRETGCPICFLSIVRLSKITTYLTTYNFQKEMQEYWNEVNQDN